MSQFKVMGFTLEVGICYISPDPFESFSLNFTKCSSQWDRVQKQWLSYQDFKRSWSHYQVMRYFTLQFSVSLCLNDFQKQSLKCSPHWDVVQNPWLNYAQSRSSSHLKVMEFTLQFCVHSISSEPFVRFSFNFTQLFLSMRQCAEPMTHSRARLRFDVMGFCCPSNSRLVQWKTCFT